MSLRASVLLASTTTVTTATSIFAAAGAVEPDDRGSYGRLQVFTRCWLRMLDAAGDGQREYYRCMCDNHLHGFLGRVFDRPDPQDNPCVLLRLYLAAASSVPPPTDRSWLVTHSPADLHLSTPTQVFTMATPPSEQSRNYVVTAGLFAALALLWCLVVVLLKTVRRSARARASSRREALAPSASLPLSSRGEEAGAAECEVGGDPPPYDAVVSEDPPPYWSLQTTAKRSQDTEDTG